ncbi:hypothetical protein GXM_01181 [Nostoc sphaeroides CCNUC1]|uniref:Uncharacterized protein n=1 Tax=Nostoc sphaeroides CCNUC1 TaxID=2653204 RepID=A0A5P8VTD3_9NOSO|nr:hypothetical protein GXM_01181 [Nostoc sphaeroides CCNUC1]
MRCQVKKGRDASEKEDGDCIGNKERSAEDKDVNKRVQGVSLCWQGRHNA